MYISACDSGVIFDISLLVSGFHHPRIAVTLEKYLLSPSRSFSIIEFSIVETILFVNINFIGFFCL